MTTSESESPESEIAPPIVLDSRKAKLVALVAAAPGVALLCYWLYAAAHRFGLLSGTSHWAEDAPGLGWAAWAFASAVLLAIAVMPLYFAIKIWLRPTLGNLRRVPFIAAFWCIIGVPLICRFLVRFEWMSFKDTIPEYLVDGSKILRFPLTLSAYFLVRYAMVLWFKTPELGSRTTLRWFLCFFLWGSLQQLGDNLAKHFYPAADHYYESDVYIIIQIVVFVIIVYVAMYVYRRGRRSLGLRQE